MSGTEDLTASVVLVDLFGADDDSISWGSMHLGPAFLRHHVEWEGCARPTARGEVSRGTFAPFPMHNLGDWRF